ncbi:MAG: tetratricopeptide repeat protein, partial [Ignavibacteriae bacterium]|nr:tetratricopeptide repeat protein [Ignavibacteriota bacterium]
NIDGWVQLGIIYDHLKLIDSSDVSYENALKIDPDNAVINNNYAYSLSVRGKQLDRALSMAETAVKIQPENVSYRDTYAWVHYQLGNYKEALDNLLKATGNADVSATILEHLGDAYLKNGSAEQAIAAYKKALEKSPERHSLLERLKELKK